MSTKTKYSSQIDSENLSTAQVANLLGVSRRFLEKDRHEARQNGTSPKIPYAAIGHRTVRYRRSDVLAFLEANRVG